MIDHGQGVQLGPVDRSHLEQMREWRNDYRVWSWCRQNDLISDLHQERWFERQALDPTIKMYLIWGREQKPVGVCGLTSIDLYNRRAEFSLYVAPNEQRKGYAKGALITLMTHGFKTLGLNSIWGESFEGNPAIELFKEVGFKQLDPMPEFYFREGKFLDAYRFSILASQFRG